MSKPISSYSATTPLLQISSADASAAEKTSTSVDHQARQILAAIEISGEDSDEEISSSLDNLALFQRVGTIKAEAMTIPCRGLDGKVKNIKGSTLIELVHDIVKRMYGEAIDLACLYEKDIDGAILSPPSEKGGIILIKEPKDWLMSMGGWKGMMPKKEVEKYFFSRTTSKDRFCAAQIYDTPIIFPIKDHRLHIPEGFSIRGLDLTSAWEKTDSGYLRIPTGKTDLSYPQITTAINHIKKSFALTDRSLAQLQLSAFSRASEPPDISKNTTSEERAHIGCFFDYLNGLMFGIEPSGLNAAFAIGLMTLDLIAKGRLSYETAFKANQDGGFYPYACFGNNKNSYRERDNPLA